MARKHAKTLDDPMFSRLLSAVSNGEHSERDQVMILLSYKAGLRAVEIAGLDWDDVTDAEGNVRTDSIFVPGDIAKNGIERSVPMNPHLCVALHQLRAVCESSGPVIYPQKRHKTRMTAGAVCMWFRRLYEKLGFENCSSHSGRRTFITKAARLAGLHECSMRDVQMLAGHASLETTQKYVDASPHVDRLVKAI